MKVLISGAAGFIGEHAAVRFLEAGATVVGFDNLSRPGTAENLAWIRSHAGEFEFTRLDIRDRAAVEALVELHPDLDVVLHLAAQVAVTHSVREPRLDFEINALGTLNLLEAVRRYAPEAAFLYASTNKVYGTTDHLGVVEEASRYRYADGVAAVDETTPLDFHSPYACSKGAADQYVADYSRIYGLRTVVFRQSCIYGPRQFGLEDQGWVAWFAIARMLETPVVIYGDGKQVRDLLWIDDLLDVYDAALAQPEVAAGKAYNVGGGPENTLSVLELVERLEAGDARRLARSRADWRPGDQRIFVADVRRAADELDWAPRVGVDEGIDRLLQWVDESRDTVRTVVTTALGS